MLSAAERIPLITLTLVMLALSIGAQSGLTRPLNLDEGATVEVFNHNGRISARVQPSTDDPVLPGKLTATTDGRLGEKDVKVNVTPGHAVITVDSPDAKKRIDLVLLLPARTTLKVDTSAGAIEVTGNFAAVDARTETATVAVDVPDIDLKYSLLWTETRPRVLADFDLASMKELSAGRFEIKGRYKAGGTDTKEKGERRKEKGDREKDKGESEKGESTSTDEQSEAEPRVKDQSSKIKDHS